MGHPRDLIKKLLHIEDTPERTALAYAIGIFLGFSPFVGFHTLAGLAVAFLFGLNRVSLLLGVWSNAPWWIVPYYIASTWVGMWVIRFEFKSSSIRRMFQLGADQGFVCSEFWKQLASHSGLFLSFIVGSLILAVLLALAAYPLSLRWIRFCRSCKRIESKKS